MMELKPCAKCNSTNLDVRDCGYSSFNPHWVVCLECGYRSKSSVSGYKAVWNQLWEDNQFLVELAQLRTGNDRLQASIAKLPQTEDGVHVVPGMTLWFVDDIDRIVSDEARRFSEGGPILGVLTKYGWVQLARCSSTFEAAEAAKAKETP